MHDLHNLIDAKNAAHKYTSYFYAVFPDIAGKLSKARNNSQLVVCLQWSYIEG